GEGRRPHGRARSELGPRRQGRRTGRSSAREGGGQEDEEGRRQEGEQEHQGHEDPLADSQVSLSGSYDANRCGIGDRRRSTLTTAPPGASSPAWSCSSQPQTSQTG